VKRIILFIAHLIGLVSLVVSDIAVSFVLPFPYSKVSIFFAGVILWLLWGGRGSVVWFTFFGSLIVELYSAAPFGLTLFSSTIAMLFGYWLYRQIFTNRSWYAAIAISLMVLCLYRLTYVLGLIVCYIFGAEIGIYWQPILTTVFWEIIFTTILISILYFIMSVFSRRLRSAVIEARYFRI